MYTQSALDWALRQYHSLPPQAGAQPTIGAAYLAKLIGVSCTAVLKWKEIVPIQPALAIALYSELEVPLVAAHYPTLYSAVVSDIHPDALNRYEIEVQVSRIVKSKNGSGEHTWVELGKGPRCSGTAIG